MEYNWRRIKCYTSFYRVSQKKLDFRDMNRNESYCLKQQFYGTKFGRNKWKSFNMIFEKEPPIILRWPQKCSQVTGKTIKGRRRISGLGVYWGKGESHKFSKKAWKPVVPIGLLLLLPKKSLGWVKNVTFLVIQKNMNFDRKWVENVWYSRAFISSTKV